MPRKLSSFPLSALRAFEAAARLGSFKAAAAELAVTPAAISHQVKALEAHLGAMLFTRLHRSLQLTEAGKRLAATVGEAFLSIHRVLNELASDGLSSTRSTLVVSAGPTFASKWLAPRLHRFHDLHPRIELRLLADPALADLAHDPCIDVAIRYGAGGYDAQLYAEPLWSDGRIVPVCAPSLAAGLTGDPMALTNHMLLRTALPAPPAGTVRPDWTAWLTVAGVTADAAAHAAGRGLLFSTTQLALEAALTGRGIALAPAVLVEDDLRNGRLAVPSSTALEDPYRYWLLCRRDRMHEARVRAFTSWLRLEARSAQGA